ncbi:hypothetical protein CsatB_021455 [Cannabis sativa]
MASNNINNNTMEYNYNKNDDELSKEVDEVTEIDVALLRDLLDDLEKDDEISMNKNTNSTIDDCSIDSIVIDIKQSTSTHDDEVVANDNHVFDLQQLHHDEYLFDFKWMENKIEQSVSDVAVSDWFAADNSVVSIMEGTFDEYSYSNNSNNYNSIGDYINPSFYHETSYYSCCLWEGDST